MNFITACLDSCPVDRSNALELLEHLQAVKLAITQPDIKDKQAWLPRGNFVEAVGAVCRFTRLIPLIGENSRNLSADIVFVVNNENVMCHG